MNETTPTPDQPTPLDLNALAQADDAAFLREYLRRRYAECPGCGEPLPGVGTPRCPRCGERLRVGVALSHPHLRGWLAVLIPTLAGGGIGLLFAIVATAIPHHRFRGTAQTMALYWFWSMIPAAVLVAGARRRVARWPAELQFTLAAVAWVGLVAGLWMLLSR
jgi:hypothetical protein